MAENELSFETEAEKIASLTERIDGVNAELAALLTARGQFVTAAESLTGGMISSAFVNIPGSSNWFSDGYVTYTDAAKHRMIGVPAETLERETAVSADVGLAMALGALERSGADYSVAVTGLAGPFTDDRGQPIALDPRHEPGLVYIACACASGAVVRRFVFSGGRMLVRKKTNWKAVQMLKKLMQSLQ